MLGLLRRVILAFFKLFVLVLVVYRSEAVHSVVYQGEGLVFIILLRQRLGVLLTEGNDGVEISTFFYNELGQLLTHMFHDRLGIGRHAPCAVEAQSLD